MAGHSKFKNVQHRKGRQDSKRSKLFNKLIREITTAVKTGSTDVRCNPRLRHALIVARSNNLPKERIDRIIKSARESTNSEDYDEVRYEGYAPQGIGIIVEALTDNRHRTASSVRAAFTKYGGSLGETGTVSYMFKRRGIVQYPLKIASKDEILERVLECGALDASSDDVSHIIYTSVENFTKTVDHFNEKYGPPEESYIGWVPNTTVIIHDKVRAQKLLDLVDLLEDNDDVQRVFGNYELSDAVYEALKNS